MKTKTVVVKMGIPYCPHCRLPIESELVDSKTCRCNWCGGLVRCLTTKNYIDILKHVRRELLEQWKVEMENY